MTLTGLELIRQADRRRAEALQRKRTGRRPEARFLKPIPLADPSNSPGKNGKPFKTDFERR